MKEILRKIETEKVDDKLKPKTIAKLKGSKYDSTPISVEEMAAFCKRKGFVYPSGEIYGGLSGFWDFGNIGVELKLTGISNKRG